MNVRGNASATITTKLLFTLNSIFIFMEVEKHRCVLYDSSGVRNGPRHFSNREARERVPNLNDITGLLKRIADYSYHRPEKISLECSQSRYEVAPRFRKASHFYVNTLFCDKRASSLSMKNTAGYSFDCSTARNEKIFVALVFKY